MAGRPPKKLSDGAISKPSGRKPRGARAGAVLRETLREMEAIMQNASLGIVFTRDRQIIRYNPKFCAMYGYADHEIVGPRPAWASSTRS